MMVYAWAWAAEYLFGKRAVWAPLLLMPFAFGIDRLLSPAVWRIIQHVGFLVIVLSWFS